ncbi:hypothetical protein [Prochlorothrix hollandica]|nr:hypothetical protein [Prochlorothrix hollandica]
MATVLVQLDRPRGISCGITAAVGRSSPTPEWSTGAMTQGSV